METTIEEKYGDEILSATFNVKKNIAQLRLYKLSNLRFPLMWSTTLPIKEAHAALKIFEKTGVSLNVTA